MIGEQSLVNCLEWHIDFLNIKPSDCIAQVSRPTFDFSIPEIFLPLTTGASMYIPKYSLGENFIYFLEELSNSKTTILQFVPTVLSRFINYYEDNPNKIVNLNKIQHLVCNGEKLSDNLRKRFYKVLPQAILHNCYGPTEACVAVTEYKCEMEKTSLPMLIGKPAPNVFLFLSNSDSEDKNKYEIFIGGVHNSFGYVNDNKKTRESFITMNFNGIKETLYKTGDEVKVINGEIQFLGRKDRQVKYKGVRIELSEIENIILSSKLCKDVRVEMIKEEEIETFHLACFIVLSNFATEDQIKSWMTSNVPADRLPSKLYYLKEMPFTKHGKLDTGKLIKIHKDKIKKHYKTLDKSNLALSILENMCGRSINKNELMGFLNLDSLSLIDLYFRLKNENLEFYGDLSILNNISVEKFCSTLSQTRKAESKADGTIDRAKLDIDNYFLSLLKCNPEIVVLHTSLFEITHKIHPEIINYIIENIVEKSSSITFAIPTFTPEFTRIKDYDYLSSRSETGYLGELLLNSGAIRTKHPVYSFATLGPLAKKISAVEWWHYSPFGESSIFEEFSKYRTLIGLMGTFSMAHPHRCEYLANVPYYSVKEISGNANFSGKLKKITTYIYIRDIKESNEELELSQDVDTTRKLIEDLLEIREIASTTGAYIWVSDLENRLVPILKQSPYSLLLTSRFRNLKKMSN